MSERTRNFAGACDDNQIILYNGEVVSLRHLLKSLIDLGTAIILLLILLPVFLAVSVAVKLDGGPVLFSQMRVGRGGQMFRCFKFRSMKVGSDNLLRLILESDAKAAQEWARNRKLVDDPRVTSVGKFLRKTSLDELPQLINVLRRDMSLVGPRPIVKQELELYGAGVFNYYKFRPGITGLWQISGRSNTTFAARVKLDSEYAENWSLRTDLGILLRTIPAVLFRVGAH